MDAILVIDVQNALIKGAYRESEVLDAINIAIGKVRERRGIVIFIQHCHSTYQPMKKGNPGWDLDDALDVTKGDIFVEKEASDSFYESRLGTVLKRAKVDQIFVTGLQTEYCVDATCRSALSKGYAVTLVSDGHTTGDSHFPAAEVIKHHNNILANLAHPKQRIRLCKSSEI